MRYLPGERSSWVDIGKEPQACTRYFLALTKRVRGQDTPTWSAQNSRPIRTQNSPERDREYKMILTVQISPFLALLTLLFDRCNIPFAISLAILILSPLVKHICGWFTFTWGLSLLFCRNFNKQPFSARRKTTNAGSVRKKVHCSIF